MRGSKTSPLCHPQILRTNVVLRVMRGAPYKSDFHKRTKHIRGRHHFVRECADEGDITVHWVPGDDNPADSQ